ncbi:Plasma membrane proteolipid 3 [Rhodotorula toruloides]|nr:Plasma membrane proteolipid 3 [Rhodotorula toruloides]KAJ8294007.1 Plasma membrane proteolipid 3 [Rhodotorula toruloides]
MPFTASDICKIILAIILPPLGVFLERGCNADFWINVLLTILGYIPGIIHALYIILASRINLYALSIIPETLRESSGTQVLSAQHNPRLFFSTPSFSFYTPASDLNEI